MYGGCFTILEELSVGEVWIGKQEMNSPNYQQFLQIVQNKKIQVRTLQAGEKLQIGQVQIRVLWPEKKQITENQLNNNSLVLQVQYQQISILFTGDIENIAEEVILSKNINLKADILKVAHHGSKTSSSQRFIEAVSPKIALIGVGKNNMFGHPNREVIERLQSYGTKIYRTDECGEISITVNNRGKIVGIKKCIK